MPTLQQQHPAALLALASERDVLRETVSQLRTTLEARAGEILDLKRQIEWLRKQVFGAGKSEKLDRLQLLLKLQGLEQLAAQAATPPRQVNAHQRRAVTPGQRATPAELYAKLPVRETLVIDPPEVQAAPQDYERIGEERTFEVEITPPQLHKRELIRPKYRFKTDRALPPVIAPAPARPVPGGHASAGLLAWVCVAKYLDHLPLHRQEQMLARWGAPIPRANLCEWIRIAAEWLQPLHRLMRKHLLGGDYLQADETPVHYHDPTTRKGALSQGYLWLITRPGEDILYDWRLTRRHAEATSLLGDFKGLLQSDGYEAYESHADNHPGVKRVGCWAHARRKFADTQTEDPRGTRVALKLIATLYRHERAWDAADTAASRPREPRQRAQLRQTHFARNLRWLHTLALALRAKHRPKSGPAQAASYLLTQWPALKRHLEHGQTHLDTNHVENAVRPAALGRKNWLFIGHPEAGQRSAILYSLIHSCRRHGKNPHDYLRDVLSRLPRLSNQDDLTSLLPKHWQPPA